MIDVIVFSLVDNFLHIYRLILLLYFFSKLFFYGILCFFIVNLLHIFSLNELKDILLENLKLLCLC